MDLTKDREPPIPPLVPALPSHLLSFKGYTSLCKGTFPPIRLHFAINNGDEKEVLNLIESGIDINFGVYGQTPLSVAIFKDQFDIACSLVENGACLTLPERSKQQMLPMHLAARAGSTALIQKIIDQSPSYVFQRDRMKFTPLHWAAAMGHLDSVLLLIDNSADVNAVDDRLKTPLHRAIENDHVEIVKYLLAKNGNISHKDFVGWTPLSQGVACGYLEIVQMILACDGADPNVKDKLGRNCLHLACNPKCDSNLWALCQASLDNTSRHLKMTTPAIRKITTSQDGSHYVNIASLLIDCGVDIHGRDYNRNSPLFLALKFSSNKMVILLLNAGSLLTWATSEEQLLAEKFGINFNGPPSLKFLSKNSIRKFLGKNISRKILCLPLPKALQTYMHLTSTNLDDGFMI